MPPIHTASHIVLLQERPNPSTDYFILPILRSSNIPFVLINHDSPPPEKSLEGAWVILVRYVPSAWKQALTRHRAALVGISYFMDDDLFDSEAAEGMPLPYRWKLRKLATSSQSWLRRMEAELWVSAHFLANKYAAWNPRLIEPAALDLGDTPSPVRVFYHGSASHNDEKRWLRDVMAEVLAGHEQVCFEIFGGADVNRLYRDLPRVSVVHPMSWENYLQHCRARPGDIGLAPLLPSAFNRARSATKFFDITRCGAVGIYANTEPFSGFVRDGEDGLLVDHDPAAWRDAILRLAADASLRGRLAAAAQARLSSSR